MRFPRHILNFIFAVVASVCVVLLFWLPFRPTQNLQKFEIGKQAPDFFVQQMDGRSFQLSSQTKHWVILDFWATWCHYCTDSLKEAQRYKNYFQTVNIEFLALNLNDSQQVMHDFLLKHQLELPVASAPQFVKEIYPVENLPVMVIIDPSGRIYKVIEGVVPMTTILSMLNK